jgi:hypothetical protein
MTVLIQVEAQIPRGCELRGSRSTSSATIPTDTTALIATSYRFAALDNAQNDSRRNSLYWSSRRRRRHGQSAALPPRPYMWHGLHLATIAYFQRHRAERQTSKEIRRTSTAPSEVQANHLTNGGASLDYVNCKANSHCYLAPETNDMRWNTHSDSILRHIATHDGIGSDYGTCFDPRSHEYRYAPSYP